LRGTEDAARGDRPLQQVGLEPLRNEISRSHRAPAEEPKAVRLAKRPKAASDFQYFPQFTPAWRVERRRRTFQQPGQERPEARHRRAEILVSIRVFRRKRANRFGRAGVIDRENQRPTVWRDRDQARVGKHECDAAALELHIAHDRRPQRSDCVRQCRT